MTPIFPAELAVTMENIAEESRPITHSVAGLEAKARSLAWEDGKRVAIYTLAEIRVLRVTVELVK